MSDDKPDLYEQFSRLEWLVRRYQLQSLREFGPMANPHKGQGRILALLKMKPEISQKDLSSILDIRSQSLGELLAKLERSGFITRTPSQQDRRVMDISLTEAGRKAANQTGQETEEDTIFGCLKEDEQTLLGKFFERIIGDLEEKFGGEEWNFHRRDFHGGFPFDRNGFEHLRRGQFGQRANDTGDNRSGFHNRRSNTEHPEKE
ncbi:MarR family winged helix-turn-helix transcriptional regulator [Anaerocolumna xylanovorans]|uniref:DNA-binding transcriptional regulator, MarR family n=1 Tax=Anaerocolumna xylanovorans DSM 12503 TaxID=1121345 RepID=A0A1M7XYX3_9FIRM|nr:MarR family transcriptional regulator [Anaerocolumna xylanovorans]SHO44282.1 DNA-binding transcriptional regulator, MarR family [Anaerocolumna xylanovorans DSM 12503]